MTVTVSPSASGLPFESLMTGASVAVVVSALHSWAHSGQISSAPSSYVYSELQLGQGGSALMGRILVEIQAPAPMPLGPPAQ